MILWEMIEVQLGYLKHLFGTSEFPYTWAFGLLQTTLVIEYVMWNTPVLSRASYFAFNKFSCKEFPPDRGLTLRPSQIDITPVLLQVSISLKRIAQEPPSICSDLSNSHPDGPGQLICSPPNPLRRWIFVTLCIPPGPKFKFSVYWIYIKKKGKEKKEEKENFCPRKSYSDFSTALENPGVIDMRKLLGLYLWLGLGNIDDPIISIDIVIYQRVLIILKKKFYLVRFAEGCSELGTPRCTEGR